MQKAVISYLLFIGLVLCKTFVSTGVAIMEPFEIDVFYGTELKKVPVDENVVTNLVEAFSLSFRPETLHSLPSKQEVPLDGGNVVGKIRNAGSAMFTFSKPSKPKTNWEKCSSLREELTTAATLSMAVYAESEDKCLEFIQDRMSRHNVKAVGLSKHGPGQVLIAEVLGSRLGGSSGSRCEEEEVKAAFVAIRGSTNSEDWLTNFEANASPSLLLMDGQIHSGYAKRAQRDVPLATILTRYRGKPVIFCGHSLGGAVAAVLYIYAYNMIKSTTGSSPENLRCFTFGAPLFCEKLPEELSSSLFNVVSVEDVVPLLLINEFRNKKTKMIEDGLNIALEITDSELFGCQDNNVATALRVVLNLGRKVATAMQFPFSPVGNFRFVGDERKLPEREFDSKDRHEIKTVFSRIIGSQPKLPSDIKVSHSIETYIDQLQQYDFLHSFPVHDDIDIQSLDDMLCPVIGKAQLNEIKGLKSSRLVLWIAGSNLGNIRMDDCQLKPLPVDTKSKPSMSTGIHGDDVLEIKINMPEKALPISDQGVPIKLANTFGSSNVYCVSKPHVFTANEETLLANANAGMIIEILYQRMQAMEDISVSHSAAKQLIQDFDKLARLCGFDDMPTVAPGESFKSAFEQKKDAIRKYLASDLEFSRGFSVWFSSALSALLVGSLLLPFEGTAFAAAATGAAAATILSPTSRAVIAAHIFNSPTYMAFFAASNLFSHKIQLEMKHIVNALLEALPAKNSLKQNILNQAMVLGAESQIFLENALSLLYENFKGNDNFKGTIFELCTESEKNMLVTRCEVFVLIADLRKSLAKQCIISVMGKQKAGKGTLLEQVWGIEQPTQNGLLNHTEKPQCFQVDKKIWIFDMPGRDGINESREKFAKFGAIGNLTIMVIHFEPKPTKTSIEGIVDLYAALTCSRTSRMILCINQCARIITNKLERKRLEKDLDGQSPIKAIKKVYVTELNAALADFKIQVNENDVLFTDFLIEEKDLEDTREAGIVGAEGVQQKIIEYLTEQNVYDEIKDKEAINQLFTSVPKHLNPEKAEGN